MDVSSFRSDTVITSRFRRALSPHLTRPFDAQPALRPHRRFDLRRGARPGASVAPTAIRIMGENDGDNFQPSSIK